MSRVIFSLTTAVLLSVACIARAQRVPGSIYPVSSQGVNCAVSAGLFILDDDQLTDDDVATISSMQGVTAQRCPKIYRIQGPQSTYAGFLQNLTANFPTMPVNTTYLTNVAGLLKLLASEFRGYVIANLSNTSISAAYTYAGSQRTVVVTSVNEHYAVSAGLPKIADLTSASVLTVINALNVSSDSFSRRICALQDPTKFSCLGDYTSFAGAINFWDTDMNSELTQQVLASQTGPSAVFGWGVDESGTVAAASVYGGFVHASDWAKNLATLTNFEVAPGVQRINRKPGAASGVHTVCFLMTDGDNIQWLVSSFTNSPLWWASPDRGHVNLGWTLSPALRDLAPVVMQFLYSTASNTSAARDFFVAGPSGIGYTFPDVNPPSILNEFVNLTADYMQATGLNIVNVLGQTYSEAAAAAYVANPSIDGLLWYDYATYQALNGNITFINGKPVIGARYQLWDGEFESPQSLVAKLLAMPKDPSSVDGYSLIPVHVWTNNVTDVRYVADQLAKAGGFQVLPPDEFVATIAANLHP